MSVLDALGQPVIEGDRVAYAACEAGNGKLHFGTVIVASDEDQPQPTVQVAPEGLDRSPALLLSGETDEYAARFIKVGSTDG